MFDYRGAYVALRAVANGSQARFHRVFVEKQIGGRGLRTTWEDKQ